MNPDTIFTISCIIALLGWITLIVISPFWLKWDKFVIGVIITLLSLVYTSLNLSNFALKDVRDFGSLDGIMELYKNKALLMAGWAHFLAFDLLAAFWIKKNSVKYRINHWLIVPSIILTCMLGPLGFLSYLLVRWVKTKNYFADYNC